MRSLTRSLVRAERSNEVWPLIVWTGSGVFRVGPGCDRGSVRPDPPILDQKHLVAIDRDRLAFPDHQRAVPAMAAPGRRRAGRGRTGRSRRGAAAVAGSAWPPGSKRRRRQRFGRRDAVDSAPIEDARWHRKLVAERDLDGVAALEPEVPALAATRSAWREFRARSARLSALRLQRQRGATLGEARPQARSGPARPRPSPAISSRRSSGNLGLAIGPMRTIFCCVCPSCDALPRCCQKGPFFCCGGVGSCYKPAARGIAAGYGCFSRGRGGTGRRAGFRFQ